MRDTEFRTIRPHERDAVLDLLAHWLGDREFFARYFRYDPTFRDDLCFVAIEAGEIISTLQVFRKQVRIGHAVAQVAGIGNVYTADAYRERGIASELLTHAVAAMHEHQFDLSLLFAVRLPFYGRHGWRSHVRHLVYIEQAAPSADGPYTIASIAPADLEALMALYATYNGKVSGSTVRDRAYWQGQMRYAGNPHEDFLIARAGDAIVAYARGTTLYDFYVIMEHAYLPGHQAALAQLVRALHSRQGAAFPGTITQLAIAPDVQDELQRSGLSLRTVEDIFWMWRIISPDRLAAKLGVSAASLETDDVFFRLLPPEHSVYWIADRF